MVRRDGVCARWGAVLYAQGMPTRIRTQARKRQIRRFKSIGCDNLAHCPAAAYYRIVQGTPQNTMIVLLLATAGSPCVTMWLKPNRALSRRGLHQLIMVLVALALVTASLGAWQGNVFAPLFALVESVAMAYALSVAWRAGDRGERIILDETSVEVQLLPGRRCVYFPSHWVRVLLDTGDGHQRLLLTSHGRNLEIGAFLGDQERVELSRKLKVLLADVTTGRANRI